MTLDDMRRDLTAPAHPFTITFGRVVYVCIRRQFFMVGRLVLISFGRISADSPADRVRSSSASVHTNALPPSPGHIAGMLNGDSSDCRLENLEWVSRADTAMRREKPLRPDGLPVGIRVKYTRGGPRYQAILRGRSLGCYATPQQALFVREC